MKTLSTLALITLATNPCFALSRLIMNCASAKNSYQVVITDNQGIGFNRVSSLVASIRNNQDQLVASFPVTAARFGSGNARPLYFDTQTSGTQFVLSGPTMRDKNYSFSAIVEGQKVNSSLSCSVN